jgi:hypothetical protein
MAFGIRWYDAPICRIGSMRDDRENVDVPPGVTVVTGAIVARPAGEAPPSDPGH